MALGSALGSVLVAGDATELLCVAGVALGHIHLRFAWVGFSRRRHEPLICVAGMALMALGGALRSVLVAGDPAALCVARVVVGDIYLRFAWQAWRLVTSTFVLRGRRGAYGTGRRAWVGFSRR